MKLPTKCSQCGLLYDHALARICPYCGTSPHPDDCPDPLCILDIPDSSVCNNCPRKQKPNRGWGGRRAGAGAPTFNLNRLKHGQQSKLLKKGIERMAEDPLMRAVLLIIARLATQGEVPPQTRQAIQAAMKRKGVSYES